MKKTVINDIKPATKKLILRVSDNSECFMAADYAEIELGACEVTRIRMLSEAVRNLNVYRVSEFNYACNFKNADYEQDWNRGKVPQKECRMATDCNLLNVTDTGFYWSGLYKHTDVRWSTDTVPLTALDEVDDHDQREEYPVCKLREAGQ